MSAVLWTVSALRVWAPLWFPATFSHIFNGPSFTLLFVVLAVPPLLTFSLVLLESVFGLVRSPFSYSSFFSPISLFRCLQSHNVSGNLINYILMTTGMKNFETNLEMSIYSMRCRGVLFQGLLQDHTSWYHRDN